MPAMASKNVDATVNSCIGLVAWAGAAKDAVNASAVLLAIAEAVKFAVTRPPVTRTERRGCDGLVADEESLLYP